MHPPSFTQIFYDFISDTWHMPIKLLVRAIFVQSWEASCAPRIPYGSFLVALTSQYKVSLSSGNRPFASSKRKSLLMNFLKPQSLPCTNLYARWLSAKLINEINIQIPFLMNHVQLKKWIGSNLQKKNPLQIFKFWKPNGNWHGNVPGKPLSPKTVPHKHHLKAEAVKR